MKIDPIDRKLHSSGALMIVGPRGCDKTTTAKRLVNTIHTFDIKKEMNFYKIDPNAALKG